MDPTKNLEEQLKLSYRILNEDYFGEDDFNENAYKLAELVQSLNDWIIGGGFLPEQWKK